MQSSSVLSLSPSFNSYSSTKLAEIAARVIEEFKVNSESEIDDDVFNFKQEEKSIYKAAPEQPNVKEEVKVTDKPDECEDDEFEFAFVCKNPDSSSISADEIFHNGQIRPLFPIFNRDFTSFEPRTRSSVRIPLIQLFNEDRDTPSCSSSEADELDGIQPGTYCVWTPKALNSPEKSRKSNSTGSSKRWKFSHLLHRSNSEGKDAFVFLSPSNSNSKKKKEEKVEKVEKARKVTGNVKELVVDGGGAQYVKNRSMKEFGDKRKSFLPYKQDLVRLFANVNGGLSRNIVQPF